MSADAGELEQFTPAKIVEPVSIEELLRARFDPEDKSHRKAFVVSDAQPLRQAKGALLLPDDQRPKMPLTKNKYLVKENPELVMWERESRKFLRRLSPAHGHRVSASMVYEWATGISVKELIANGGSTRDLRKINQILHFYYGKPYMTYICGRKVPKAYRIPPGWYVRNHRPMTLSLYAEYLAGTLYP